MRFSLSLSLKMERKVGRREGGICQKKRKKVTPSQGRRLCTRFGFLATESMMHEIKICLTRLSLTFLIKKQSGKVLSQQYLKWILIHFSKKEGRERKKNLPNATSKRFQYNDDDFLFILTKKSPFYYHFFSNCLSVS